MRCGRVVIVAKERDRNDHIIYIGNKIYKLRFATGLLIGFDKLVRLLNEDHSRLIFSNNSILLPQISSASTQY